MAVITETQTRRTLTNPDEISAFLSRFGIWYRRFENIDALPDQAGDDEILAAFAGPIEKLKAEGGYTTADVINVHADTPGLDAMLAKFSREHWHSEDEVRFIVRGRGVFHIHPEEGPVFRIEVREGDMINVPTGTRHWFDLCEEKSIRCIRLFQDPSGWSPHYTESGEEEKHEPLCMGPSYFPPESRS